MPRIQGDDYGRLDVNSCGQDMAILLVIRHLWDQRLVAADPRFAEVGTKLSYKVTS